MLSGLELFGYLASLVVAVSLMMGSIARLRWVNLAGAAMFTAYGALIDAWPVAALNAFIVLVNLYHLYGIYQRNTRFHLVRATSRDPVVRFWLDYFRTDIQRHVPEHVLTEIGEASDCHLILRDSEPVAILVGRLCEDRYEVLLDYAFPPYQDFRTGEFLYHDSGFFSTRGIRRVVTESGTQRHQAYLERMGFRKRDDAEDLFELVVE